MKGLITLFVLFVALCCANEIPPKVLNGYYPQRSGDVLVVDKALSHEESLLVVFGEEQLNMPETITETEVAHILTQALALPNMLPTDETRNYEISSNYLAKPRANLFFIIETTAGTLEITQGKPQSKVTMDSLPYSTLGHSTSMVTGVTPSVHGIVSNEWLDRDQERTVRAYSSWNPMISGAAAPSLQDTLTMVSAGESLIFAASSCKAMTRALSAKPYVSTDGANNFGIYWTGFDTDSVYDDQVAKVVLNKNGIIAFMTAEGIIETDATHFYLQGVGFDLKEDFGLLVDYAIAEKFVQRFTDGLFGDLVADYFQDMYSFAFTSIKGIENAYGEGSDQFDAAMELLNHGVEKIVNAVDAAYTGVVLKEIVYMNGIEESPVEEEVSSVIVDTLNEDHMPLYAVKTFYPQVYLARDLETRDRVCADLDKVVSSYGVELECLPAPQQVYNFVKDLEASDSSKGGDSDTATFQIATWITVALIFAAFGGSLTMLTVDASSDSLLYSQDINHPNPVNNLMHTPASI